MPVLSVDCVKGSCESPGPGAVRGSRLRRKTGTGAPHCPWEPQDPNPCMPCCSHECDYGPVSLASLPVLTAARTKFTSSADVDAQVRESLDAGQSLYTVDEDLLKQLQPDVILTQVRVGAANWGPGRQRTGTCNQGEGARS